ncbi:MAG: hypothetical protein ABDH61_02010 [Acidilobaceae archaeon]
MRSTLSWMRCSLCGRRAPLTPCGELELCPYCAEALGCGGERRELLEPDEGMIRDIKRRRAT